MRSISLDYLRIILCLLVVELHYWHILGLGRTAVVGFFVISGYFMAREFENKDSINLPLFYKKKAINLLPEYLAIAIPAFIISFATMAKMSDPPLIKDGAFILFRMIESQYTVSWFMTCLFCFIVIAPIFFLLYQIKYGIHWAFALSLIYGLALNWVYGSEGWLYTSAQITITYFIGGMLARKIGHHLNVALTTRIALIILCVTGLSCLFIHQIMVGLLPCNLTRYSACLFFIFLTPLLDIPSRNLSWFEQQVAYFAVLTYPIYLFHTPIKRFFVTVLTRLQNCTEAEVTSHAFLLFYITLTLVCAILFHRIKTYCIKKWTTNKQKLSSQ